MMTSVSYKAKQFFTGNINLRKRIADLRYDDVTLGLRLCSKILKLYKH